MFQTIIKTMLSCRWYSGLDMIAWKINCIWSVCRRTKVLKKWTFCSAKLRGGSGILENQIFIFFLEYFAIFDIPKATKAKFSYSSIYSNQIFHWCPNDAKFHILSLMLLKIFFLLILVDGHHFLLLIYTTLKQKFKTISNSKSMWYQQHQGWKPLYHCRFYMSNIPTVITVKSLLWISSFLVCPVR